MNKELYVSSTPHETKVALVEDDQLAEVFFERENEYTLAGSIYKGRVTRVLPGMQSAFVDIGLERDAFLYVSDFLEVTGDEEDEEEFGSIPVPRNAIDVSKAYAAQEAQLKAESAVAEPEIAEESEPTEEDFAAPAEEQSAGEETEASTTADPDSAEGTRPWRGRRRRRGGRRGQGDERNDRPEPKIETSMPVEEAPIYQAEPRPAARSRTEYGPPAGYTPIVLPGESISKYRNLSQQLAPKDEETREPGFFAPIEDSTPSVDLNAHPNATVQETESHSEVELRHAASESAQAERVTTPPAESALVIEHEETEHTAAARQDDGPEQQERLSVAPSESQGAGPEARVTSQATATEVLTATAENPTLPEELPAEVQSTDFPSAGENREQNHRESATQESPGFPSLAAPSVAPEGRTLEHEVLEDEEMEFHPVPDDLNAISEVEADEELVLEEETLDADNGDSDRWIPKIADVDEDEVVAAEERGEQIYGPDTGEEEEEESGEEEETNGRAEVRAASPTAGYQQRQTERPGSDRRGFRDRNRRGGPRRNFRARPNTNRNQPLITDLLKEGQEVLIQIAKEPLGKKGARITSHIALPGRFLVYMPTVNHVGVSRKIASDEERQRLKRIVTSERENGLGGFIVRTAAASIKEEDLRADIRFLKHLWAEIKSRAENSKSPALIYHDLNLVERVLRDQVNADFSQIWVDTEDEYERVVRFASRFQPSLVRRIKLYTKDTPLFEQFGIQDEINRSLKSKVWLKSGGHIVINQTEALVAIDINTGKYVGKTQRLEDTIAKTNVDAVKEIVRQIRLRDLGGIIVIDFIDMDERKNRQKVMQALEEALRNDRAPSKVLQFNDFGLVAITRKRVKQSLERTLGETCPYCVGAGFVKSVPTVCNELYIEMRKMAKVHDKTDITVRVNPEVAKALKANNGKLISEMEDLTGKTVLVKSDPLLHQENFDIH
jgi:Rne/Rng family ribonuclease